MAYPYSEDEELYNLYGMEPPPQAAPPPGGLNATLEELKQLEQKRPPVPQPKLWQRLLAGAAGGAMGYVNAGGRTNVGDPSSVSEAILAPTYRTKVEQFEQQRQGLLDRAKIEAQQQEGEQRTAEHQARLGASKAAEAAAGSRQRLYEQRANQIPAVQSPEKQVLNGELYERDPATGKWNKVAGERVPQRPMVIPPGGTVLGPDNQPVYTSPQKETPPPRPTVVAPGATVLGPDGKPLFTAPNRPQSEAHGSFKDIVDEQGNVKYFNPSTRQIVDPPPGARKQPVSAAENLRRATAQEMIRSLDELEVLGEKHKDVIGVVSGRWNDIKRRTVGMEGDVNDLFAISKDLSDQLLRARTGAAVSPGEYRRLLDLVPTPNTPLPKFKADLARFRSGLQRVLATSTGKAFEEVSAAAPQLSAQSVAPVPSSHPAKSSSASRSGIGHKVGDTVMIGGKPVKIKAIYPDGTFDPE